MTNTQYAAEKKSTGRWGVAKLSIRSPFARYGYRDDYATREEAAEQAAAMNARADRDAAIAVETAQAKAAEQVAAAIQVPVQAQATNTSSVLYGRGIHHAGDGFTQYESPVTPGRYSVQIWDES